ncbi:Cof-type HAD-IIB family hydrolase [Prevotella dentasini]|uniref:Cof-type HAD-IIB family hydrolase n=1 Tax=Prevotella dentasini TaxID=589537 RepID=UPI000469FD8B|nr:Cof-type HAD-IIB family hydrolase [Prevotella dentasini]
MAIKAAFFDIDGTLVSFSTHTVPASTADALARAKQQGLRIYIATGRPVAIINNIGPVRHLVDGYITFNGAYTFVGGRDVVVRPIPRRDVEAMLADARRRDYTVLVCGKHRIAVCNHHEVFDEIFVRGLGVTNIDTGLTPDQLGDEPILQLTPFFTEADEREILPLMPGSISARWNPRFTDITARGADKGSALRLLAGHEGLKLSECIAFGDGGNDLSILRAAGVGIAMGNATDAVKEAADYVTDSVDEDGIRNALLRLGVLSE